MPHFLSGSARRYRRRSMRQSTAAGHKNHGGARGRTEPAAPRPATRDPAEPGGTAYCFPPSSVSTPPLTEGFEAVTPSPAAMRLAQHSTAVSNSTPAPVLRSGRPATLAEGHRRPDQPAACFNAVHASLPPLEPRPAATRGRAVGIGRCVGRATSARSSPGIPERGGETCRYL